ncbi:hypothetical protein [Streptomyces griseoluteus]|uniref:hypothetical protein n=1 Tax=Streptomyces griseoluteus TaxID=29306 RepID=UPI0036FAEF0F
MSTADPGRAEQARPLASRSFVLRGDRHTASGSSTGSLLTPPHGYRSNSIQHLTAIQLDQSGNVWLADNWSTLVPPTGGTSLVELIGAATPVCTPLTPVPARPATTSSTACPAQTSTQPR